MICFGQIRQTNKSLTYYIYKNGYITKIYFCFPCSNGGVFFIMRTITSSVKVCMFVDISDHLLKFFILGPKQIRKERKNVRIFSDANKSKFKENLNKID